METEIIAKTQTGKEITCAVEIDETGRQKTQYPIVWLNHEGARKPAIELTRKQAETLLNRKFSTSLVNILLKEEDLENIRKKAQEIKKEYAAVLRKNEEKKFTELVANNSIISFIQYNYSNTHDSYTGYEYEIEIKGLPNKVEEHPFYEAIKKELVKIAEFTINSEFERSGKIVISELLTLIKKVETELPEQIKKERKADAEKSAEEDKKKLIKKAEAGKTAEEHKQKLIKKAKETGKPQIFSKIHSKWNSYRESGSDDYIVTYINADGSTFTEEVKAEPDHY